MERKRGKKKPLNAFTKVHFVLLILKKAFFKKDILASANESMLIYLQWEEVSF